MKKILTVLTSLCLVLSLSACENKEEALPKMSAIEVMNEVFKANNLETFGIAEFMDEASLEESLTRDETSVDFSPVLEAVLARPMAMSVSRVAVVRLANEASDSDLELMKNFRFLSGCIVPEENKTHVEKRDNYLIYTYHEDKGEDLGLKLIDSFKTISLDKKQYENPSIFELAMNEYLAKQDKYLNINTNTIPSLIDRDLNLPRNLSEAVNQMAMVVGKVTRSGRDSLVDNLCIYVMPSTEKFSEVEEFLTRQVTKGEVARYKAEGLTIEKMDEYLIIRNN